jgi:hypothetical protein
MTDIAVVTRDHLPDKAASAVVKKMKTPDYKVSSAANRMETLNLRDSTTFGCYKCEELPKDRFTKVEDYGYPSTVQSLRIYEIQQNVCSGSTNYI